MKKKMAKKYFKKCLWSLAIRDMKVKMSLGLLTSFRLANINQTSDKPEGRIVGKRDCSLAVGGIANGTAKGTANLHRYHRSRCEESSKS